MSTELILHRKVYFLDIFHMTAKWMGGLCWCWPSSKWVQ